MRIEMNPIGYVRNNRRILSDDHWGEIISEIELAKHIIPESLEGIKAFSHLEIIFYMDKVKDVNAVAQYRHPRNNEALPKLGTFAQRNKNRPNKIGLTTVEFVKRLGNKILVRKLDAIDGTPILDIKPVMKEFEPQGNINQPDWVQEIMNMYW